MPYQRTPLKHYYQSTDNPNKADYALVFIRKPENGNRYDFAFGIDREGVIDAARVRIYR